MELLCFGDDDGTISALPPLMEMCSGVCAARARAVTLPIPPVPATKIDGISKWSRSVNSYCYLQ